MREDEATTEGARVIRRTKRTLVVGGAALAIVGGGGAALAAGGDGLFGKNEREGVPDDAGGKLKVKAAPLQKAPQQAHQDPTHPAREDRKSPPAPGAGP